MWNVCLKGLYISVFLSWFRKWPEGDLPLYIQYLSMGTEALQVILSAVCVRIAALYLLGSFCFHVWWLYLYQMIETICLWPEDIYSMVQYNSKWLVSIRGCHVKMQSIFEQAESVFVPYCKSDRLGTLVYSNLSNPALGFCTELQ